MTHENTSAFTRRDLWHDRHGRRRRRDVSGDDKPRLRRRVPYKGPIKLDGDPKGASVLILGAGLAGMAAASNCQGRLQGPGAGISGKGRRALLDLRGGDSYTELGGPTRTASSTKAIHQPGPVAHSLPSPARARLLQAARRRAGALHPGQPQRLAALGQGVRRQAAALSSTSRPTSTAMSRSCWPRSPAGRLDERCRRRTGRCCSQALRAGARSTRTTLTTPS